MNDIPMPFVSIVIPTFNAENTIEEAIKSLMNLDYPKDKMEIIVVDAFSKDRTFEKLSKYPVSIYQKEGNPATAYNFVIDKTKGELLALADGDAIVDKQWLKRLVFLLKDSDIAGAGGLCLTWNKEKLIPRAIGYELQYRYESMPRNISRIATMNVVYKKSVVKEVGGFNEELPIAYDTDIGHRIRKLGYRILFEPSAIVYHYHRPTLQSYYKQQYTYGKNLPVLYLNQGKIAKGDEVTGLWMNIQPFIYSFIFLLILSVPLTGKTGILLAMALVAPLLSAYTLQSARIARKYKDFSAMFLIVLFIIRGIAWTHGGVAATLRLFRRSIYQANHVKGG